MSVDVKSVQRGESKLLFEVSKSGKECAFLPARKFPEQDPKHFAPETLRREKAAELPEVSEPELVRHFVNLSKKNFSVDTHFYPLGSCTMKYNPKIHEDISGLSGFTTLHPMQSEGQAQGTLQIF